jgi:toxin FitB
VRWLSAREPDELFVSAVTFGEIQRGAEATRATDARKAQEIEDWLDAAVGMFPVIAVDGAIFRELAKLMHRRSKAEMEDAMIAATARVLGLTVATRNIKDFRAFDVPLFDPFGHKG